MPPALPESHYLGFEEVGDVTVVRFLHSRLTERDQIQKVADELIRLVEDGRRRILLDFEGVRNISSFAFGKLLALKKALEAVSGDLRLCSLHPDFLKLFAILRFDSMFAIAADRPSALAELAKGKAGTAPPA